MTMQAKIHNRTNGIHHPLTLLTQHHRSFVTIQSPKCRSWVSDSCCHSNSFFMHALIHVRPETSWHHWAVHTSFVTAYMSNPRSSFFKWFAVSFALAETISFFPSNLLFLRALLEMFEWMFDLMIRETFLGCCAFANLVYAGKRALLLLGLEWWLRWWRWVRGLLWRMWFPVMPFQQSKCLAITTVMAHSPRLHRWAIEATLWPCLYAEIMRRLSAYEYRSYVREQSQGLCAVERLILEQNLC